MFDIVAFIQALAEASTTGYTFLHGEPAEANQNSLIDGGIIYLFRPVSASPGALTPTGVMQTNYSAEMAFLLPNKYQNEGDDSSNGYQDGVDTVAIKPAGEDLIEFLKTLRAAPEVQGQTLNIGVFKDITDFNEFDNNLSGYYVKFDFKVYNGGNLCQ